MAQSTVATEAAAAEVTSLADAAGSSARPMAIWLGTTAGMVYSMIVLGGVTRLTRSGLSMVDWRPHVRGGKRCLRCAFSSADALSRAVFPP